MNFYSDNRLPGLSTGLGSAIQHLHYLPFGEEQIDQRLTNFNSRYTFSAKEKDIEPGYSYFGARYYTSDLSIWLSVDPLSDKYPSLTPYNYCANNPVILVDPNGEEIDGWVKGANGIYWDKNATSQETTKPGETYLGEEGQIVDGKNVTKLNSDGTKTIMKPAEVIPKDNGIYNVDKAVEYLENNANPSSTGYCARSVRKALEAGGLNTEGHPSSAKDYTPFLKNKGFQIIDNKNYEPQKGDIAVISAFIGETKTHPYGHIQMYTGNQWISDFKQREFWPGSDYRKATPNYQLLRSNK